jgi:hypothetical protein
MAGADQNRHVDLRQTLGRLGKLILQCRTDDHRRIDRTGALDAADPNSVNGPERDCVATAIAAS